MGEQLPHPRDRDFANLYEQLASGKLRIGAVIDGAKARINEYGAWLDIDQPKAEAFFNLSLRYPLSYLTAALEILGKLGTLVAQRFSHYDRGFISDPVSRFQCFTFESKVSDARERGYGRMWLFGGVYAKGERAICLAGTAVTQDGRLFYMYKPYKGNDMASEVVSKDEKTLEKFGEAILVEVPHREAERLRIHIRDLMDESLVS